MAYLLMLYLVINTADMDLQYVGQYVQLHDAYVGALSLNESFMSFFCSTTQSFNTMSWVSINCLALWQDFMLRDLLLSGH